MGKPEKTGQAEKRDNGLCEATKILPAAKVAKNNFLFRNTHVAKFFF